MAQNGVSYHNESLKNRSRKKSPTPPTSPGGTTGATTATTATTIATKTHLTTSVIVDDDPTVYRRQHGKHEEFDPQWPPPERHSRASEFYGFVAWTSTYLAFVIYLLWAFLPDDYIIWLGVTWYPNREWAILVPAWSIMAVLFTYFAYFSLALAGTPPLDSINSIVDGHTSYPSIQNGEINPYLASTEPNAIPELYDIPIGMVNRILYLNPTSLPSRPEEATNPGEK